MGANTSITVELDHKRPCNYILLRPTNFRKEPKPYSQFNSYPLEIQYFGVTGQTLDFSTIDSSPDLLSPDMSPDCSPEGIEYVANYELHIQALQSSNKEWETIKILNKIPLTDITTSPSAKQLLFPAKPSQAEKKEEKKEEIKEEKKEEIKDAKKEEEIKDVKKEEIKEGAVVEVEGRGEEDDVVDVDDVIDVVDVVDVVDVDDVDDVDDGKSAECMLFVGTYKSALMDVNFHSFPSTNYRILLIRTPHAENKSEKEWQIQSIAIQPFVAKQIDVRLNSLSQFNPAFLRMCVSDPNLFHIVNKNICQLTTCAKDPFLRAHACGLLCKILALHVHLLPLVVNAIHLPQFIQNNFYTQDRPVINVSMQLFQNLSKDIHFCKNVFKIVANDITRIPTFIMTVSGTFHI